MVEFPGFDFQGLKVFTIIEHNIHRGGLILLECHDHKIDLSSGTALCKGMTPVMLIAVCYASSAATCVLLLC
jgi:hypothetical protein